MLPEDSDAPELTSVWQEICVQAQGEDEGPDKDSDGVKQ